MLKITIGKTTKILLLYSKFKVYFNPKTHNVFLSFPIPIIIFLFIQSFIFYHLEIHYQDPESIKVFEVDQNGNAMEKSLCADVDSNKKFRIEFDREIGIYGG